MTYRSSHPSSADRLCYNQTRPFLDERLPRYAFGI